MSFTFSDAKPVKQTRETRRKENPFTQVVSEIALKRDDNDEPLAKSFTFSHTDVDTDEGADREKKLARIRRQTSEAGLDNEPEVTVRVHADEQKRAGSTYYTQVTIWTIPRTYRPRTASTPESDTAQGINTSDNTESTDE